MIVVHDRFLTGSGTFVDASMLGGGTSSAPAAASAAHHHGGLALNELQDSGNMMVYDEDEEDQAVLENDNQVAGVD